MGLHRDVVFLQQLELFQDFDDDQMKLLAFNAGKRSFAKGKVLFKQGERALGALIILSGRVGLERRSIGGSVEEGDVGPGTILGELALVADVDRHVTATALADTQAIEIPRIVFRRLLDEFPDIAVSLHGKLALRLANATSDLAALEPRFAAVANM